jgi:hypothetical protein
MEGSFLVGDFLILMEISELLQVAQDLLHKSSHHLSLASKAAGDKETNVKIKLEKTDGTCQRDPCSVSQ